MSFSLNNFALNGNNALTAGLALTGTSVASGDATGFSLGISQLFVNLASGSANNYQALFDPSTLQGIVSGTQTATYQLSFADQSLPGGMAGRDLMINMNVIIVPEPATIVLLGIGGAVAGFSYWRRNSNSGRAA